MDPAVRPTYARRKPAAPCGVAVARFTGLPLDPVVVEHEVEVASACVRTIDDDQLKVVGVRRYGVRRLIVQNTSPSGRTPVDTKRRAATKRPGAVCDQLSRAARVNVRKERRDDRQGRGQ